MKVLFTLLFVLVSFTLSSAVMYGTPTNPIYAKVTSLQESFPDAAITSWCRSKKYNRSVGGVEGSRHITCMAVDMVVPNSQVEAFVEMGKLLGFRVLIESDHIHLEERN